MGVAVVFRLGLGLRVGLDDPHLINPAQFVRLGTRNKTSLGLDADLLPQLARLASHLGPHLGPHLEA